jgi:hypothetical protein
MFLCTAVQTNWAASVLGASGMSATGAMMCRLPGSSKTSSGTDRGPDVLALVATIHPSYILHIQDEATNALNIDSLSPI